MNWFELEQPEGKKLPAWRRTFGVSEEGNEVFVPAAIAGNEQKVFLCVNYDGTPFAHVHNHVYVPAIWLSKEFPDTKELCNIIIARAHEVTQGLA
jgi:hypothetical protein